MTEEITQIRINKKRKKVLAKRAVKSRRNAEQELDYILETVLVEKKYPY